MLFSKVVIDSLGYELPPNVISSNDLESRLAPVYAALHLQKGQLEAITGIQERRFWDHGFPMYRGAIAAGQKALENTNIPIAEIGMLIYGGVCRDNLEPATACAVADGLGLSENTQLYDLSNACLGVLNGMVQVANAIELGQIEAGLIVSCESARQIVELTIERLLAAGDMALFKKTIATLTGGSGAVAVLMASKNAADKGHQLMGGVVRNDARHYRLCRWGPDSGILGGDCNFMETDSVGVLQNGVSLGLATFEAFKSELSLSDGQLDRIICHQVGATHQQHILNAIGIPVEKDFTTFRHLGNIGTVSLPITAAIAAEREFLQPGDLVGLFGIGSGLNCIMLGVRW